MVKVNFYDSVDDCLLKFAVIIAKHNGRLVMCRHKKRDTYELPGGHREENEEITDTACRELSEETGASEFDIRPVCVYSVTGKNSVNKSGEETYGMLFYADIYAFKDKLECEIDEIRFFDELPPNLTYPEIQPYLMEEYRRRN